MNKDFAQKKDGWCGPAALSFALSQIGIDVSQEKIAKETHTSVEKGVDPFPLKETAEKYGAKTEIVNGESPEATLKKLDDEIKRGHAVIVDYLVNGKTDGGHYVVLLGASGNDIKIWNPSGGHNDTMGKTYFISNWRDKTEKGKIMKNWAMILQA